MELQASGFWPTDLDQDGLPDGQERVLGADSARWDTDGDGYSDGYEFAAQSSIIDPLDIPAVAEVHTNLTARGGPQGSVRLLIGILSMNGILDDKIVDFGTLLGPNRLHIPFSFIRSNSRATSVAQPDGSILYLMETGISANLLETWTDLTYFISVGTQSSGSFEAAGVADILTVDGIPCLRFDLENLALYSGGSLSVFKPIPGGNQEPPPDWVTGSLCVKESEPQSQSGAMVTMFTSSADCSEPWHGGSCPPDCGESAGTTYTTVDPFILLGG